jgi:lysophospholipase L1-like esterase
MSHIVLLGDSIFDNAAYVAGGPDVAQQLRESMPASWKVTLRAVDGSMTTGVPNQLAVLPADTSHLVVSIGGNDALNQAGILNESAQSSAEVLDKLAHISEQFEFDYHRMLTAVRSCNLPTAVCTIYYPRFPDPLVQRLAVAALSIFNDCILREAIRAGVPVLDLRLICNEDGHYANPIEPSAAGGARIARAISRLIAEHDFQCCRTEVFI